MPTGQEQILGTGSPQPWSHLEPVVAAELSWGNTVLRPFRYESHGTYDLDVGAPLHLDRLRERFAFPDHIALGENDSGQTWVVDGENRVKIVGPSAVLGPYGTGPGLLARLRNRWRS